MMLPFVATFVLQMVQYLLKIDKLKFKQQMGKAQYKKPSANSDGSQQRRGENPQKAVYLEEECQAAAEQSHWLYTVAIHSHFCRKKFLKSVFLLVYLGLGGFVFVWLLLFYLFCFILF